MQHGRFFWYELVTVDRERAKRFLSEVFGWEGQDAPVPGGGTYTSFVAGGGFLCGLVQMHPSRHWDQLPAHWMAYVAVSNLTAAIGRTQRFGGQIMTQPVEIEGVGTYQIIRDPAGAHLTLIEAQQDLLVDDPQVEGQIVWNELTSRRPDLVRPFYRALFDWVSQDAGSSFPYEFFSLRDDNVAGLLGMETPAYQTMPSQWNHYFGVSHIDSLLSKVENARGKVVVPPLDVDGVGRIAIVQEPGGAPLTLLQST